MTFKEFVEDWCRQQKDMLHDPDNDNKRFFLVRDIAAIPDFTRTLPDNASPCVLFDMMFDAHYYSDSVRECTYTLYFMGQAGNGTNLPDENEEVMHIFSKEHELIQEFREYCEESNDKRDRKRPMIETYFHTFPYGPLFNGWYATGVTIEVQEVIHCID